jgi:hypothetical protein
VHSSFETTDCGTRHDGVSHRRSDDDDDDDDNNENDDAAIFHFSFQDPR